MNRKHRRINKACLRCDTAFRVVPSREKTAKYCSTICQNASKGPNVVAARRANNSYVVPERIRRITSKRMLGNSLRKGSHHTEEAKEKIRVANLGRYWNELHWSWKGDSVGYRALHKWVVRRLGRPKSCVHCGKKEEFILLKNGVRRSDLEWANEAGDYKRDVLGWLSLCIKCHRAYDAGKRKASLSHRV